VLANPLTYLSTLLLFAVGLLMFGWSELRINFEDRTYRLVSELDWLTFRPRGQDGSCDELDHIQVDYKPDSDPLSPCGWISLVWKDPRRPAYVLGLVGLDMVRVIDGVPRFELRRTDLPGRLASQLDLPVEVIGVEEEWLNPSTDDSRRRTPWGDEEADSPAGAGG